MMITFYLIALTILISFFNRFCMKNNYLVSETGDGHQKFASKTKTPLTGGIFIYLSILFFFDQLNILLLIFSLIILMLGIISDLKLIKSANKRLFFQILIVIGFIIASDTQITDTRIDFLDDILSIKYFNYLFVIFCILILINGSNFFDGLNTLNIGYYFFIILIINYLIINNEIFTNESHLYKNLFFILIFAYFLNFINKVSSPVSKVIQQPFLEQVSTILPFNLQSFKP